MKILSLGGPTFGKAAANIGVSGGILSIMKEIGPDCSWMFLDGHQVFLTLGTPETTSPLGLLKAADKKGHYHHCRSKLWAILHSLPDHLESHEQDEMNWAHYKRFQEDLVRLILARGYRDSFFIQDYDFALVAKLLREQGIDSRFFLHNPWPKKVPVDYVDHMVEIAEGMLGASMIGMHTRGYARDYCSFVNKHMPGYTANSRTLTVEVPDGRIVHLVVAPLGLDKKGWETEKGVDSLPADLPLPAGKKVVAAIARPDPAKALPRLIEEWGLFQQRYPELGKDAVLVLIIPTSQSDVPAFVRERHKIQSTFDRVSKQFPGSIILCPTAKTRAVLKTLYKRTAVFLVPSFADGLNLVGLEYVLCQDPEDGHVLAMSESCGAYSLVDGDVVKLAPRLVGQMADAIAQCLKLAGTPLAVSMMRSLKQCVPDVKNWYKSLSKYFLESNSQAVNQ